MSDLGQMQAGVIGALFDLDAEAVKLLQVVPYKGALPTAVPTDPLIYRFYECSCRTKIDPLLKVMPTQN